MVVVAAVEADLAAVVPKAAKASCLPVAHVALAAETEMAVALLGKLAPEVTEEEATMAVAAASSPLMGQVQVAAGAALLAAALAAATAGLGAMREEVMRGEGW